MLKFVKLNPNVIENLQRDKRYERETIVKAGPSAKIATKAIEKNKWSESFTLYKNKAELLLKDIGKLKAKLTRIDKQDDILREKIQVEKTELIRKEMQNIVENHQAEIVELKLDLKIQEQYLKELYELEQKVSLNSSNKNVTMDEQKRGASFEQASNKAVEQQSDTKQRVVPDIQGLTSPIFKRKNKANMTPSGAVNENGIEDSEPSLLQQINARKAAKDKMQNNNSTKMLDQKIGIGSENEELNNALAKRKMKLEQNATESINDIIPILAVTREQPIVSELNQRQFSEQQKEISMEEKSSLFQKQIEEQVAKLTKSKKYTDLTAIDPETTVGIPVKTLTRAEKTQSLIEFEKLEKQLSEETLEPEENENEIIDKQQNLESSPQMQELERLLGELEQYSSIPDVISPTSNEILKVFRPLSIIQEEEECEEISEHVAPVKLKESAIEKLAKQIENTLFKKGPHPAVPPKPKNNPIKTALQNNYIFGAYVINGGSKSVNKREPAIVGTILKR